MSKPQARKKPLEEWWLGSSEYAFDKVDGRLVEVDHSGTFVVTVHLGMVDGRVACIGVDFRSFNEEKQMSFAPLPGRSGYARLGSPEWRSIPVGNLFDRSIRDNQLSREDLVSSDFYGLYNGDSDARTRVAAVHDEIATRSPAKPKRGPKRQLTDELVRSVVGPAYRNGGRRPVVAVQQALKEAGFIGSGGSTDDVTMSQASKAVARARKLGVIPPAKGKGRP
jgi:hypothetical protein